MDVTNDFYWISRLSPSGIVRILFHNLSASLMHKLQTTSLRRCIEMRFFLISVSKHWLWTKEIRKTMFGRRRTECLVWLEIGSNNFLLVFDMLEYIIKSPLFESFFRSQLDKKNKTFEIRFMIDSTYFYIYYCSILLLLFKVWELNKLIVAASIFRVCKTTLERSQRVWKYFWGYVVILM